MTDRNKQGQEARARVLSGKYNKPLQTKVGGGSGLPRMLTYDEMHANDPQPETPTGPTRAQLMAGAMNEQRLGRMDQQQEAANRSYQPTVQDTKDWLQKANAEIDASSAPKAVKVWAKMWNTVEASPAGRLLNKVSHGMGKAQGIDTADPSLKNSPLTSSGSKIADKVGEIGGLLAGSAVNPSMVPGSMATSGRLVASGLAQKLLPSANGVAQRATAAAIEGAAQNTAASMATGHSDGKELLESAALGAAGGAALSAAGDGLGHLWKLFRNKGIPDKEISELLDSPPVAALMPATKETRMAAAAERSKLPYGADPVITPEGPRGLPASASYDELQNLRAARTQALPEPAKASRLRTAVGRSQQAYGSAPMVTPEGPRGLPAASEVTAGRARNVQDAQAELADVDAQIKDLHTAYETRVIEEYQYLKQSLTERGGVDQGGVTYDSDGYVTGRYGRQSNNPRWYRDYYADHGRVPSNKELYRLARERVDNGAADDMGDIPSWKQENGYDETVGALSAVREELAKGIRDIDPALHVTPDPIVGQALRDLRRTGGKNPAVRPEDYPHTAAKQPEKVQETPEQASARQQNTREFTDSLAREQQLQRPLVGRGPVVEEKLAFSRDGKPLPAKNIDYTAGPEVLSADPIIPNDGIKAKVGGTKTAGAAAETTPADRPAAETAQAKPKPTEKQSVAVAKAEKAIEEEPAKAPLSRPDVDDATKVSAHGGDPEQIGDEVEFARRVRQDDSMPAEVRKALQRDPVNGQRTSNELNTFEAAKLIEKHGVSGTYNQLINKKGDFSAIENTAAMMLSRHLADAGDVERAVDLIAKTGRGARSMGQAIQALSMWNKMQTEGALLAAQRQLNRRVRNAEDMQALSPEQAANVASAAKKLEAVASLRSRTAEVVDMISNKKTGEALTDAEQQLVKEFQDEVSRAMDDVHPIVKAAREEDAKIVKDTEATPPAYRKRHMVQDYLQIKADDARAELARKRNLGFASKVETPDFVLYSRIGASVIANKYVSFADWSEQMLSTGVQGSLFGGDFPLKDKMGKLYTASVNQFRKANGLPTVSELEKVVNQAIKSKELDEDTANALRAMASEIGFFADGAKQELTRDLQLVMKGIGTSTLGEKISTTQTSLMLLNAVTFARNASGVGIQILLDKFAKVAALPVDMAVSKFTGNERTIRFFAGNQEKFWKNFAAGTKAGWDGVDPRGMLSAYDLGPRVFQSKKNPLHYLEKALGASLQGMDTAMYHGAYGDLLATYGHNLGLSKGLSRAEIKKQMPELIKQLDDNILAMAEEAGIYATYQDKTILSRGAQGLKKGLNAVTDLPQRALREGGILPEKYSIEGFGLGDLVLKFAKTPANIIMRGIEFSPLGFAKSVFELQHIFNKAKFDQAKFVQSFGRATVGTIGLTGFGAWMAANGIVTGAASMDKDVRSLQEASGKGAYQVNMSALRRFFASGLDREAAKPRPGDLMAGYAWAQPAAISFAMGADAVLAGHDEDASYWDRVRKGALSGLRTILENPMMQGAQSVVDAINDVATKQDLGGFTRLLRGSLASFVPAVAGQIRRAGDNYKRETRDESFFDEVLNNAKNKIPGLSRELPVSYNSLGQPREYLAGSKGGAGQALNALANPVPWSIYNPLPEAAAVVGLAERTGDDRVYPRVVGKSITIKDPKTKQDEKHVLTKEEYSKLQQAVGTETNKKLQTMVGRMNDASKDKGSVKSVTKMLTKVNTKETNKLKKTIGR